MEERFTKRAETPVEQLLYDSILQIQSIAEDVHRKTGVKLNLGELTYDDVGRKHKFRPMGDILPKMIRSQYGFGKAPKELISRQ